MSHSPHHTPSPSHSPSPRRYRYRIERNSNDDEEVVVPYWEEPSSANYHMLEEIRLLKMKNNHFQEHMERMKLEYEELRKTVELMDENEKELMHRNSELSHRLNASSTKMHEMKSQIQICKFENEELKHDMAAARIREEELRKKNSKLREEEVLLISRLDEAQEDREHLKAQLNERARAVSKSSEAMVAELKKEMSLHEQRATILNQQTQDLKRQICIRDELIKELQQRCRKVEQKLQHSQAENRSKNEYMEQLSKVSQQLLKAKEQLDQKNTSLLERKKRLALTKIDQIHIEANASQAEDKSPKANYEQIVHDLQIDIDQLTNEVFKLKKDLSGKHQQLKESSETIGSLKQQTTLLNQKVSILQRQNIELKQAAVASDATLKQRIRIEEGYNKIQEERKQKQEESDKQNRKAVDNQSLSELEAEYESQLQALRRLVVYKRYPPAQKTSAAEAEIERRVRREEQHKFDLLVKDYKSLKNQLHDLEQELVSRQTAEEITFRNCEERKMYIEAIRKWEIAYQELQAVSEAKIISREEEINLLNLKLSNYLRQ